MYSLSLILKGLHYLHHILSLRLHCMCVLLLALFLQGCTRKDIYVSPSGDDVGDGTIAHPYQTLGKAISEIRPGETIWLREGTYRPQESDIMGSALRGLYACVYMLNANGSEFRPLTISAFANEKVVIDLSNVKPENKRVSGFFISGDYWRLRKFDIVGIQVTQTGHTQSEYISLTGSHCIIEQVNMHDGMGIGVYAKGGHDNLILNCDAYNNYDPVSENGKGGNCDGFGFHLPDSQCYGNMLRGCRAWRNSDDGFDLINSLAPVVIDSCWAWQNGYDSTLTRRADGAGFKAGGYGLRKMAVSPNAPINVITNCIAWYNKNNGFYANHHLAGNHWQNNRAAENACNFNMVNQKSYDDNVDVGGYDHVLCGNVSYNGRRNEYAMIDPSQCKVEGNTFMPDMDLNDSSFISLDSRLLWSKRKPCGSLPDIDFLKLRPDAENQ